MTIEKAQKDICRYLFKEGFIGTALPGGIVKLEDSIFHVDRPLKNLLLKGGWSITGEGDFSRSIAYRKEDIQILVVLRAFNSEIRVSKWK